MNDTYLKKKDLYPFNSKTSKGIFNQFQEILRGNNISDKSNAFNRFISLMLAKIVDEEKSEDAVLDFQFKMGVDTFETFQDRLQTLYIRGMERYLKEEITYYTDAQIEKMIEAFPRQTAKIEIREAMRRLKFYTTNEFSFKEIHNEKLFRENAKVLMAIVQLLQNYRFKYSNKEPFLGSFFELMLNDGYKQSEGQFFTPLPIAKFIVASLPLFEIIDHNLTADKERFLPTVIDYACGSGHFLTEAIDAIQNIINKNITPHYSTEINTLVHRYQNSTEWAGKYIFGIEKDYRLARTSQVACFLNGDGEANIIFGDGLDQYDVMKQPNGLPIEFDVLIANPPYSVDTFKEHLKLKNNDLTLLKYLSNDAKQIEVLFIERMKQLLKSGRYEKTHCTKGGYAGIILPISILDSGGIYTKTREILLQHFDIKAIVELGSKSFMATSIKPLILFLQKRHPYFAIDRLCIAEDFILGLNPERTLDFIDSPALLQRFAEQLGFSIDDYKTFLTRQPNDAITQSDYFKNYEEGFRKSAAYENLKKKSSFAKTDAADQKETTDRLFYDTILEIEKDKFFYFLLTCDQQTILVKSDKDTTSQKTFLGYEFSERRGQEGMYATGSFETVDEATQLYDNQSQTNFKKVNAYIAKAFKNEKIETIDTALTPYLQVVPLTDLMTFDETNFDMSITTSQKSKIDYEAIWQLGRLQLIPLKDIANLVKGTSITKSAVQKGTIPVVAGGKTVAYYHNRANFQGNTITVSASGANAGYIWYHTSPIFASDCSVIQSKNEAEMPTILLYYLLNYIQDYMYQLQRGQAQPHVYIRDLNKILLPILTDVQKKDIIDALQDVEKNTAKYLKPNIKPSEVENEIKKIKQAIILKKLTPSV